jgi:hypothetical protein
LPRQLYPRIAVEVIAPPNLSALCHELTSRSVASVGLRELWIEANYYLRLPTRKTVALAGRSVAGPGRKARAGRCFATHSVPTGKQRRLTSVFVGRWRPSGAPSRTTKSCIGVEGDLETRRLRCGRLNWSQTERKEASAVRPPVSSSVSMLDSLEHDGSSRGGALSNRL